MDLKVFMGFSYVADTKDPPIGWPGGCVEGEPGGASQGWLGWLLCERQLSGQNRTFSRCPFRIYRDEVYFRVRPQLALHGRPAYGRKAATTVIPRKCFGLFFRGHR
jgi:hypothetical protein